MEHVARGRFFQPQVELALRVIAVAMVGILVVVGGSAAVTMRSVREEARQAVCAARLDAVRARNPIMARGLVRSGDHCRDLAVITGEWR